MLNSPKHLGAIGIKVRMGVGGAALIAALLLTLAPFATVARAAAVHPFLESASLNGATTPSGEFNKACGAATDSKGDLYVANSAKGAIDVFTAGGTYLTQIVDANAPCGLAVDSKGNVYALNTVSGNVVRFAPQGATFPPAPGQAYEAAEAVDSSGEAKGVAVDPVTDMAYVSTPTRVNAYDPDGNPGGFDEVQVINPHVGNSTGGTFRLSFAGSQTAPLPLEASPAEVQSALQSLSTIGAGNVSVVQEGQRYLVTFKGALADSDVEAILGDASALTGGSSPEVHITEQVKGFNGHIGEGTLVKGFGVGAWGANGNVYVADETGHVYVFTSTGKLRAAIDGSGRPGGAYATLAEANIAVNQTNGHLLVSDVAAAGTVDEFEPSGSFVSQITHSFADAEPTAIAVDSSEGASAGRIYISTGAGPGAHVYAFGPLPAPTYRELPNLNLPEATLGPEKPSLKASTGLAFDSRGNLYVISEAAAGIQIFVPEADGFRYVGKLSDNRSPKSVAVDSQGNVFVGQYTVPNGAQQVVVEYPITSAYPFSGATPTYGQPIEVDSFRLEEGGAAEIAINPANDHLFVAHYGEVREFDSAMASAPNPPLLLHAGIGSNLSQIEGIGVYGKTGVVYIFEHSSRTIVGIAPATGEQITRFALNGVPLDFDQSFPFNGYIAVDQSNGHVYVVGSSGGPVYEYEASGAFVGMIPRSSGAVASSVHVAVDNAAGANDRDLFVSGGINGPATVQAFAPPQYGQPPVAVSSSVEDVDGATGQVTLVGTVNPNAAPVDSCHFQYVTRAAFEATGFGDLSSGGEAECEPFAGSIGSGEVPVTVRAQVSGLSSSSAYEYRLLAASSFGQGESAEQGFGPPGVDEEEVVEALNTEAIVSATVDADSISTSYRCEYGPTDAYGQATVEAESKGLSHASVSCSFVGLDPGATYHFRVIATNAWATTAGEDRTFETESEPVAQVCPNAAFRTGPSATLPDCRAYELVSPPLGTLTPTHRLSPGSGAFPGSLASADGDGLVYFGEGTPPGFPGNGSYNSYRSGRTESGWITSLAGPEGAEMASSLPGGVSADQEYSFWGGGGGTLPAGQYLRLPGGALQTIGLGEDGISDLKAIGVFISAGAGHVIFTSEVPLTEGAPVAGKKGVYDRPADGTAHLVSTPPPGASPVVVQEFDADGAEYQGASADGATVSFRVGATLYIHRDGRTSSVATGTFKEGTGASLVFGGLSKDGSRLFYLETPAPSSYVEAKRGELFVYDADMETTTPIGSGGDSVLVNVSADGSHVYFVSRTVLNPGESNAEGAEAVPGSENLYVWSASAAPIFIATVAEADIQYEQLNGNPGTQRLGFWTQAVGPETAPSRGPAMDPSRTSANGAVFAFESVANLTSYDSAGHPEVYLYEPGDGIRCVSCNAGTTATSGAVLQTIEQPSEGAKTSLAPSSGYTVIANLSADGSTILFETAEGLVPRDRNGVQDVYEWHDGTRSLISSGVGTDSSYLLGASEDARDVFFMTNESLASADTDAGAISLYDARVGGGFAAAPTEAPCRGEECRGGSLSPPPGLSTPGSASSMGSGNVTAVPKCPPGKRAVKKAGSTRCTAKKSRHRKKHKHGTGKAGSAGHGRGK